jgi:hypothetical protein
VRIKPNHGLLNEKIAKNIIKHLETDQALFQNINSLQMAQVPDVTHTIQDQFLVNDCFVLKTHIKPRLHNLIHPHNRQRLLLLPKCHLAHEHSPFVNQLVQLFGLGDSLRIYYAVELALSEHLRTSDVIG